MKNFRREFIKKASILTLSGLAAARILEAKPNKQIGLQLYSLREDIKDNVKGVLEDVAKIGFKTLEAANYQNGAIYGLTPMEFKNTVSGLGMETRSACRRAELHERNPW